MKLGLKLQYEKRNKKILFLASFEDASILRKFTILFLITSIVPMALLYYFYVQTTQHGSSAFLQQTLPTP